MKLYFTPFVEARQARGELYGKLCLPCLPAQYWTRRIRSVPAEVPRPRGEMNERARAAYSQEGAPWAAKRGEENWPVFWLSGWAHARPKPEHAGKADPAKWSKITPG